METNTFPTAEIMRYRTCVKLIPENIFETIEEAANNGDEWISFEDEFNIMTKEKVRKFFKFFISFSNKIPIINIIKT